jgi:6-phosphogluconolactonase
VDQAVLFDQYCLEDTLWTNWPSTGDVGGVAMKNSRLSWLWFLPSILLAGCAGFWDLPSSSGGTTPTTLSSGIFYVLNQTTKQIVGYSISSGSLQQISGSPYSLAAAPSCIAIASGGGFLYVGTANGIYLYTIGSGGSLSIGNGGNPISTDIAGAIQLDGSWLVDAFSPASGSVQLDAIPIDSNTGLSTGSGSAPPSQTFNIANASAKQMVLSPDGTNLFVALGTGGTIVVPFTSANSNPLGSTATTISVLNTGGSALSVAVDQGNHIFYIGETLANSSANSGGLRAFNYSSLGSGSRRTSPTQISGSPIASGGLAPSAILPTSGGYVYVANGQGNNNGNIAWFPITTSGTSYTIAAGKTVNAGVLPVGLAEDNESNFVLAVSQSGSPDLDAFTMSSGALTSAIQSTTGTDPVGAIAIAALP